MAVTTYADFLTAKAQVATESGIPTVSAADIHPILKPHQRAAVLWAVRGGRRAILRGDSGKVVSDRIEIVNWYATRRHYAGAGAADSGARWWALCGKTIGFSVESDSARRREHGWRQPDYAALPLCKFCERKAAAEDGAES